MDPPVGIQKRRDKRTVKPHTATPGMEFLFILSLFFSSVLCIDILYDGRASPNFDAGVLDKSSGPYLTVVRGSEAASHYTQFISNTLFPTPLWSNPFSNTEDVIAVSIDNSSVFVPGGNINNTQFGFRRTEMIAQKNSSVSQLTAISQVNTTAFHFSIAVDDSKPLNLTHEYQVVFIEPSDGSHVFGVKLGSPFTNPTGTLPAADAQNVKVLDHNLNVLFSTPFICRSWHNFAIVVDWDNLTLAVFYSVGAWPLNLVSPTQKNQGAKVAPSGQGEFHFGVLKLPLVNPSDPPEQRGDVVHHGIQEGTTEGLLYSGIFIEKVNGASGPALSGPL
ncbi:hypothetical protein BDM02DRAFT_3113217 [Thelephora ganbajun]|uniref:Uncharacterized protein n=1 Tax=Thelephora ganbajun TaxID=370292 RepID=A0ACB6ZK45_THEGA|nr:hypothetical protein BDM02DRAFT_3113217 [Thelephora ganbajun]